MGSEKKPLNPVLGELFFGSWPDKNGRGETTLTVEQVSHHPPITAYCIANASQGLVLTGHNAQKTSFAAGSIVVKQVGHAILAHKCPDGTIEKYLITLPRLRIDGLWYGSPYIELTDTSYIVSSTGYTATIEYKGKGYFGGKSHQYKATLVGPTGATTAVADGLWDSVSKVTSTKSRYVGTGEVFVDVTGPKEEVTVKPIEEQGEWETRRLWELVAKGIRTGDYELASREKTKIEVSLSVMAAVPEVLALTLTGYWTCRTSNDRGERTRRLLGHPGNSSTLSMSSRTRIVSPTMLLALAVNSPG